MKHVKTCVIIFIYTLIEFILTFILVQIHSDNARNIK